MRASRPGRGLRGREERAPTCWVPVTRQLTILPHIKKPHSTEDKTEAQGALYPGCTESTLAPAAARLFSKLGFLKGSFISQGHVDFYGVFMFIPVAEGVELFPLSRQDPRSWTSHQEELSAPLSVIPRV